MSVAEKLYAEALALPESERTDLAKRLLGTVPSNPLLERARAKVWANEPLTAEENRLLLEEWAASDEQGPISDEAAAGPTE